MRGRKSKAKTCHSGFTMVYYSMASYEDVLHTSGIHNSVLIRVNCARTGGGLTESEDYNVSRIDEEVIRAWDTLWTSNQEVEPKNEAVYLRG